MDTIVISELEVYYRVGVTEEERVKPQRLLLSVEMEADLGPAAASDDLAQTIDYAAVAQRLVRFGQGRQWALIEKLAAEVAALILEEFRPETVRVEVRKFIVPGTRHVAVSVSRCRG